MNSEIEILGEIIGLPLETSTGTYTTTKDIIKDLLTSLEIINENKLKITSDPFHNKKAFNKIKKVNNKMKEIFKDIQDLLVTLKCYIEDDDLYEEIEDLLNLMNKIELEMKNKILSDRLLKSDSLLLESITYIDMLHCSLHEIVNIW